MEKLKPEIVLLSASTTIPFKENSELIARLDQFAVENDQIAFFIGGAGSIHYLKDKHLLAIRVANSIEEVLNKD